MATTAEQFLLKLAERRGSIVSSADCSLSEITMARVLGLFYVDDRGYGYVLRPQQEGQ